jgi:hypothetical protein
MHKGRTKGGPRANKGRTKARPYDNDSVQHMELLTKAPMITILLSGLAPPIPFEPRPPMITTAVGAGLAPP